MQMIHRMHCHLHFLRRIAERGIDLRAEEIAALETLIERARPAYERPGQSRYVLTVVYDTTLGCLVTVLPRENNHV